MSFKKNKINNSRTMVVDTVTVA